MSNARLAEPIEGEAAFLAGASVREGPDGKVHLVGGACQACGLRMFPIVPVCPSCMSEDVREEIMPDTGTLYSFTVVHVGPAKWRKPLAVGYVDLVNGVRVFAHLRGDLAIDKPVTLAADTVGQAADGHALRNFIFTTEAA